MREKYLAYIRFCSFIILLFLVIGPVAGCRPAPVTVPPKGEDASAPVTTTRSGWEEKWQNTLTAAQKEGSVTVYTGLEAEDRYALAKAFKGRFGIELEFVVGKGSETVVKAIAERRAGLYLADVFIQGAGSLLTYYKPSELLRPVEPVLILPEVVAPAAWIGGRVPFLDKERMVIAFIAGYRDFAFYNTDQVKEGEIRSYKDLLNPKWKGKIAMYDPTLSGSGSQWVTFLLVNVWDNERGSEYMRQLAALEPALTRDKRLHIEWVARGKYAVGVASDPATTSDFIIKGAPVAWAKNMIEGGQIAPGSGCLGLPVQAAHPNAATVFVNWLLSKEGQGVFVESFHSPSARADISTVGLEPNSIAQPGQKIYLTDEEYFLAQPKIIDLSKQIFGHLLR